MKERGETRRSKHRPDEPRRLDEERRPVKSAERKNADDGKPGWLPGRANAPMSPKGAKRPNRQTDVIHIQAR
jgi:hypothetical protein